MQFRQHIPGFVSGFEPAEAEASDLKALLEVPAVKQWNDGNLRRFSHIHRDEDNADTLMAEMKDGKWWVVGFVSPAGALADLPLWVKPTAEQLEALEIPPTPEVKP